MGGCPRERGGWVPKGEGDQGWVCTLGPRSCLWCRTIQRRGEKLRDEKDSAGTVAKTDRCEARCSSNSCRARCNAKLMQSEM